MRVSDHHLQDQFRERETGKTYLALVTGAWASNKKVIDLPLHKYLQADGERRVRVTTADDPDGMRSVTLVKVRQVLPGSTGARACRPMSLLEVTIKTGRTPPDPHLASQGHAIVGTTNTVISTSTNACTSWGCGACFFMRGGYSSRTRPPANACC